MPPPPPPQTSGTVRPIVRKKAALCLLRLVRKTPADQLLITSDQFSPIIAGASWGCEGGQLPTSCSSPPTSSAPSPQRCLVCLMEGGRQLLGTATSPWAQWCQTTQTCYQARARLLSAPPPPPP